MVRFDERNTMQINRPRRQALRAGLASALTVALLDAVPFSTARAADAPKPLAISYQRSSTLFLLLQRSGTLEKKLAPLGFDVSWHEFSSGLLQSINSGSVALNSDVADSYALFSQAAHAPVTYYAEETSGPKAEAIIVHDHSPIRSLVELKGKRVAVTKGAGSHYLLLSALKSVGLTIKDIDVRYLEAPDGLAAFDGGDVDAWSTWDPFLAAEQRKNNVRIIADGTGLLEYNRFYTATTAFAQAHPDILQIVFTALRETGQWVKANPRPAAEILSPLWGSLPVDTVELANSRRSYNIVPIQQESLAEQQRIADAFHDAGLLPSRLTATDVAIWRPKA